MPAQTRVDLEGGSVEKIAGLVGANLLGDLGDGLRLAVEYPEAIIAADLEAVHHRVERDDAARVERSRQIEALLAHVATGFDAYLERIAAALAGQ